MADEQCDLLFGWGVDENGHFCRNSKKVTCHYYTIEEFFSAVDSNKEIREIFVNVHDDGDLWMEKGDVQKVGDYLVRFVSSFTLKYLPYTHPTITKLSPSTRILEDVGRWMEVFEIVLTNPSSKLKELNIFMDLWENEMRMLTGALANANCHLLILDLYIQLDPPEIKCLGDALQGGCSKLCMLELNRRHSTPIQEEVVEHLIYALTSPACPLLSLGLHNYKMTGEQMGRLVDTVIQSGVKHLHLDIYEEMDDEKYKRLLNHLANLSISFYEVVPTEWLHHLENCNLKCLRMHLRFAAEDLKLEIPKYLMRVLENNMCKLVELDLSNLGIDLYKSVLVNVTLNYTNTLEVLKAYDVPRELELRCESVLKHNKELRSYLDGQPVVEPFAAKLFVCGHSGVGKTTFTNNICRSINVPSCLQRQSSTEGMHMTSFVFEGKKVVIFDMAGQYEYHAFHHYFVRGSEKDAFLVMYKVEEEEQSKVERYLQYWFRFIVAHRASPAIKPKVMIAFNFFTRSIGRHSNMNDIARTRTREIRKAFNNVLDFGQNDENVYGFMAIKRDQLWPCKNRLQHIHLELLMGKRIPKICNELIHFVQSQRVPLMSTHDLVESFKRFKKVKEKDSNGLIKAALLHLHDMGEVVYFGDNGIVILNVKWFNEDVLKLFINNKALEALQRIDAIGCTSEGPWLRPLEDIQVRLLGILNNEQDQSLMSKFFCRRKRKEESSRQWTTTDILQALYSMGVLLPNDEDWSTNWSSPPSKLIIPTLLISPCPHWHTSEDRHLFFGRRYECKDNKTTLLPSGLFSILQAHLHKKHYERTERHSKCEKESFIVGKGWIKFQIDQIHMLLVFGGETGSWTDRHWIEIMIRVPKDVDWIGTESLFLEIRDEVFKTCNSKELGCPNLELSEKAIDPRAVRSLKTTTAIDCVEDLSEIKKMVEMNGLTYLYEWKDDYVMPIVDLLLPKEILLYKQKIIQDLRSIELEVNIDISSCSTRSTFPNFDEIYRNKGPAGIAKEQTIYMCEKFNEVSKRLDEMEEKILRGLEKLGGDVQRIATNIISSSRNIILQLLDGSLPRFPYFKSKDGWEFSKLFGADIIVLHALCEGTKPPHIVEGQKGREVKTFSVWFCKIAPILTIAIRVLWCAAQVFAATHSVSLFSLDDLGISDEWYKIRNWNDMMEWISKDTNLHNVNWEKLEPSMLNELYDLAYEGKASPRILEKDFSLHRHLYTDKFMWVCDNCQLRTAGYI